MKACFAVVQGAIRDDRIIESERDGDVEMMFEERFGETPPRFRNAESPRPRCGSCEWELADSRQRQME